MFVCWCSLAGLNQRDELDKRETPTMAEKMRMKTSELYEAVLHSFVGAPLPVYSREMN